MKNPFKRMKTYACYKCGHVLKGEPSKIIPKDNFTNGPYEYCGPCSPNYDYVTYQDGWETSDLFGAQHITTLIYYRDQVPCDREGKITCFACDTREGEEITKKAKRAKRSK